MGLLVPKNQLNPRKSAIQQGLSGIRSAEDDFAKGQDLRARALASSQGVVSTAQQGAADLQDAGVAGKKAIRQRASQSIAGAYGQAGGAMGGGAAAGLRQTALDRGASEAEFGLQQTQAQNEANIFASQAAVEQTVFERELGDLSGDRREKMADYQNRMATLAEAYEPGILGAGGDQERFESEVWAMIANEGDPLVRRQLLQQARAILSSTFDADFGELNAFDANTRDAGMNQQSLGTSPLGNL